MPQDAITHVDEIGSARAEILVLGMLVARNFDSHRITPCAIRSNAAGDGRTRGFAQGLVLEQRDLYS
jgi:hypothetical protein